jgi:hypothetical protein
MKKKEIFEGEDRKVGGAVSTLARFTRARAFKQIDVTRAIKGAAAAGILVERIEIDQLSGKISIFSSSAMKSGPVNPCDRLLQ